MRHSVSALFLFLSVASAACVPAFQGRMPEVAVLPNQIVSLPPIVLAFELNFAGQKTQKLDWEDAILINVKPTLSSVVVSKGGRVFQSATPEPSATLKEFMAWSVGSAFEMAEEKSGRADYHRHVVGAWRYRGDLAALRTELNATFALTLLVREIRQTTGSAVGSVLGGVHYSFMQLVVPCLTDLRDGRMVWCDPKIDAFGNLLTKSTAEHATWDALATLYGLRPAAAAARD